MATKRVLHIFNFEGVLFRAPIPTRFQWDYYSYKRLTGKPIQQIGWFQNIKTLSPPFVSKKPVELFNSEALLTARKAIQDQDAITVLLSERPPNFSPRIQEILDSVNLKFNETAFNGEDLSFFKFKTSYIENILKQNPSIKHVNFWENRESQSQYFRSFFKKLQTNNLINDFNLYLYHDKEHFLPFEQEKELVNLLLEDYHKSINSSRLHIEQTIGSTGIELDDNSKQIILKTFPQPKIWRSFGNFVNITQGAASDSLKNSLGGLGATVKLNVLGHAQNEKISALSVAGPFSPNLSPYLVLGVSTNGNLTDAGLFTDSDWKPIRQNIELSGTLIQTPFLSLKSSNDLVQIKITKSAAGRVLGVHGVNATRYRKRFAVKFKIEYSSNDDCVLTIFGSKELNKDFIDKLFSICPSAEFV